VRLRLTGQGSLGFGGRVWERGRGRGRVVEVVRRIEEKAREKEVAAMARDRQRRPEEHELELYRCGAADATTIDFAGRGGWGSARPPASTISMTA
jgi:hypothetical protein